MQNPIPKFTQSSIITEKPGILSEKLWRAPTTIELNIFCWNFAHVSFWPISTKGSLGSFSILFRPWVNFRN